MMQRVILKLIGIPKVFLFLGLMLLPGVSSANGFIRPSPISIGNEATVSLNEHSPKDESGKSYACYSIATIPGQKLSINVTSADSTPLAVLGRGSICNAYRLVEQTNASESSNNSAKIEFDAQGGQYLVLVKANGNAAISNLMVKIDDLANGSAIIEKTAPNAQTDATSPYPQAPDISNSEQILASNDQSQIDLEKQRRIDLMRMQSLDYTQKKEAEELRQRQLREAQEQARILAQQQYEAEQRAKKRAREQAFSSFMSGVAVAAQVVATEAPAIMARQQQEQAASAARLAQQQAQMRALQAQQQRAAEQQRLAAAQAQQQRDQQLAMQSRRVVQQQQSGAIRTTTSGSGQQSSGYGIGYSPSTTNQTQSQQAQQSNTQTQSQRIGVPTTSQTSTNQVQLTDAQRAAINNQAQARIRQNEEAQLARQRQIANVQTQSYNPMAQNSNSPTSSSTQIANNSAAASLKAYPPVPEAIVICSPHPTRGQYYYCWTYRDNMRSLVGPNEASGWKSPENFNSYIGCHGEGSSGPFSMTDGGMYWGCGFGADGQHNRDAAIPSGAVISLRTTFYCNRGEPFCRRRTPTGK